MTVRSFIAGTLCAVALTMTGCSEDKGVLPNTPESQTKYEKKENGFELRYKINDEKSLELTYEYPNKVELWLFNNSNKPSIKIVDDDISTKSIYRVFTTEGSGKHCYRPGIVESACNKKTLTSASKKFHETLEFLHFKKHLKKYMKEERGLDINPNEDWLEHWNLD